VKLRPSLARIIRVIAKLVEDLRVDGAHG
jgi:hypothetical protein